MNPIQCTLPQLALLAAKLGEHLEPPVPILLSGDLGAGKTTFVRFVLSSLLGENVDVPSPTFTLVQTYDTPCGPVHHYDLYRLSVPEEIFELGYEDSLHSAITFIEWPERLGPYLPDNYLKITLTIVDDTVRSLTFFEAGNLHEKLRTFIRSYQ